MQWARRRPAAHAPRADRRRLLAVRLLVLLGRASGTRTGSSRAYGGTAGPARSKARRRAMDVVRQSVYVNHALKPLAGKDPPPTPIPYPDTGTGESLRNVARMLGAGPRHPRRDGAGRRRSFDSHENQLGSHGKRPRRRGRLAARVPARPRGSRPRRPRADAGLVGVRPPRRGQRLERHRPRRRLARARRRQARRARPSRTAGTSPTAGRYDGNVPVAVDFRDLYAGIIDGHLGGDVERCLPGYRGTPTAIVG